MAVCDEYLDYDPEPRERELRDAWARDGWGFRKPVGKELDHALHRVHEVMKRWDDLPSSEQARGGAGEN
jgi:hypothetical protein